MMPKTLLATAVVALAGCGTIRDFPHHNLFAIVAETESGPPRPTPMVAAGTPIIVQLTRDDVQAPTGVYLDDLRGEISETYETYLVQHVAEHLCDRTEKAMREEGEEVYRVYGPNAPAPRQLGDRAYRLLQLEIDHAELHRWLKDTDRGEAATDYGQVDFRFRWLDEQGRLITEGAHTHRFAEPVEDGDALQHAGQQIAAHCLQSLYSQGASR